MPLAQVVLLAALAGLAEALPISGSGHAFTARIWLDSLLSPLLGAAAALGTAVGLLVAARARLAAVLRAFARPELFGTSPDARDAGILTVAAGVSMTVTLLLAPRIERWEEPPAAVGMGLVLTGLGLCTTLLVRPEGPRASAARPGPSLLGAALVGLVHGLAIFPGASRVGAALVLLLWMGVRAGRAVDLALLLGAPPLVLQAIKGATRGGPGTDGGTFVADLLFAFLAAFLAAALLRRLAERRRAAALALWVIPLGLALLAYARALPARGA
ncbi:MAG: undecaprenyl-diphosphate phosphatase [Byssovorax sp.]